ncbi:MAG: 50S ribosomal protein L3 [Chloroflexi bacterium]|nr:50S ribosomal protein L3 [Chloroflexota bacterium]
MSTKQALLGKKIGMTRVFVESGEVIPVTVIEAGPCYVTQIKTVANDGYNAIQIGFGIAKKLTKGEAGHLGNLPKVANLREVRTDDVDKYTLGQVIDASLFSIGDLVDVTGISKGKGFAGGIKRHHFKRQPTTHGASDRTRARGSSGAGTTPGHVDKGLKMPGQLGAVKRTTLNQEVVQVDAERNLVLVRGAVPGPTNGLVYLRKAHKTSAAKRKRVLQD